MDRRTALTPRPVKRNMRRDCDTLVVLANGRIEPRRLLGRPEIRGRDLQSRRTVIDNVDEFSPELLDAINVEVARCGQKLRGKTPRHRRRLAAIRSSWRATFAGRRMSAFRGRGAR